MYPEPSRLARALLRSTRQGSCPATSTAAAAPAMSDSLPYFVSSEDAVELPWSRTNVPARRRAAPDGLVLFDLLLQLAQIDRE